MSNIKKLIQKNNQKYFKTKNFATFNQTINVPSIKSAWLKMSYIKQQPDQKQN